MLSGMKKLWGGRFSEEQDAVFARFNSSLPFDRRLFPFDVAVSQAHAQALLQAGVLAEDEAKRIQEALKVILKKGLDDPGFLQKGVDEGVEDVHSFIEAELVKRIGDTGLKLHTGRSRNDQVAAGFRLWLRDAVDRVQLRLKELRSALLDLAEAHQEAVMPGYTHLQRAQPVLFAHYLLAFFEMLGRDVERLSQTRARINVSPLGAGALAGSGFPLDRELEARLLGFESVSANSLDAVSDRDFAAEFSADAALAMMHLSRLSEDWILFSSSEFGFLEFSDRVTTGSSLMPQKKNPDALELIRGKCARVYGHHLSLLALLKGLPLTYNKDMQEDKEPVFDIVDTLLDCLQVAAIVVSNTSVNAQRMRQACSTGFLNATELADYLVRRGMPFRQAHETAGKLVREALETGRRLEDLTLQECQRHSPLFEEDLFQALSLESALSSKAVAGGTAPSQVIHAIRQARQELG